MASLSRLRGGSINPKQVAVTLVTVAIVLAVGASVFGAAAEHANSEGIQRFDEFCQDVHGDDATVYNARTLGAHGGLHCTSETESVSEIHYSQLPQEKYQAYLDGDVSTTAVLKNLEPMPNTSPFGFGSSFFGIVGVVLIVFIVATVYVAMQIGPRP